MNLRIKLTNIDGREINYDLVWTPEGWYFQSNDCQSLFYGGESNSSGRDENYKSKGEVLYDDSGFIESLRAEDINISCGSVPEYLEVLWETIQKYPKNEKLIQKVKSELEDFINSHNKLFRRFLAYN